MTPSKVAQSDRGGGGGGGGGTAPSAHAAAPSAAAPPRALKLPVPVTIVTGALGAGKTTALRHLIDSKPPGEVWAVLVNDFGAIGVDGAALGGGDGGGGGGGSTGDGGGVTVRQIAGGCMCCVTSGLLTPAIAQLVRQVKPDRHVGLPSRVLASAHLAVGVAGMERTACIIPTATQKQLWPSAPLPPSQHNP